MFRKREKKKSLEDSVLERDFSGAVVGDEVVVKSDIQATRKGLRAGEVSKVVKEEVFEAAASLQGIDLEDRLVDQPASLDRRAVMERNEEIGKQLLAGKLSRDIYRGREAYAPILNRREGAIAANKYTGAYGPLRASGAAFTRITTRMDYNPEICKDYNETGYCGFGDTCKFIHDRYDYKAGWQLENEWEKAQKKKEAAFKARIAGKKLEEDESGSDYGDD